MGFEFEQNSAYQRALALCTDMDGALRLSRKMRSNQNRPEEQQLLDTALSVADSIARTQGCRTVHCRNRLFMTALKNAYACVPVIDRLRAMQIITDSEHGKFHAGIEALVNEIQDALADLDESI